MWWQAVFWILLIPLVIVEIIVFLKTKRFAWLLYALAIFVYVVAVCYTLDVFAVGRNAIILTLLASSALMALIGRRLGKSVSKKRRVSRPTLYFAIGLALALALLFILNVTGGPATERLVPVASIKGVDILFHSEAGKVEPYGPRTVTLATRELTNTFWLPLPAVGTTYRACVETSNGWSELSWNSDYEQYPEVPARSTKSYAVTFTPAWADATARIIGKDVLLYGFSTDATTNQPWGACDTLGEPLARIPIN
jgi:hypothetical protein